MTVGELPTYADLGAIRVFGYVIVGPSWGALRDAGARYMAAHLIAMDPMAEPSRASVETDRGRTVYLDQFERLLPFVRVWATSTGLPDGFGDL